MLSPAIWKRKQWIRWRGFRPERKPKPWSAKLRLPPEQIVAYIKFNQKEETGWQKWGSIEPNPDDEEDKDSSQETPSFEKQGVLPQQEPRSQQADRKDSGSCSRSPRPRPLQGGTRFTDTLEDIWIPLALHLHCRSKFPHAVSGDLDAVGWRRFHRLFAGVLRRKVEDRALLYLLPPRDRVTLMAKTSMSKLYRVKSSIYGLANAPRTWFLEVVRRMKSINYLQHSLGHLLFLPDRSRLTSLSLHRLRRRLPADLQIDL